MLRETLDTFYLPLDAIFLPIKKKTLEILEKQDYDTFEKFLNIFTGHDILGRLRNDQDFLSKIYFSYQNAVYSGDFEFALKLCDVFKFSGQRRIEPVRSRINELLNTSKDQEASRLMKLFKVKARHIGNLMLDQYIKRTETSVSDASDFRQKFGIGISDIGFMRWFFTEVLPIPFLR